MYHVSILAHLPKGCYKHNISTRDSKQNDPKGDFACRIITFGRALKSFQRSLFLALKDGIWPSTFLGSLYIYSNTLWIISTLNMIKANRYSLLQHIPK